MLSVLLMTAFALGAEPTERFQEPSRPVSLSAWVVPLIGFADSSIGGLGFGRLQFHLPWITLEATGGEGAIHRSDGTREVGFIGLGVRKHFGPGFWVRGAFAHDHEVPWEGFLERPVANIVGHGPDIIHRSGLEVGFGFAWTLPHAALKERVAMDQGIGLRVFPDKGGSSFYLVIEWAPVFRAGPFWPGREPASSDEDPAESDSEG